MRVVAIELKPRLLVVVEAKVGPARRRIMAARAVRVSLALELPEVDIAMARRALARGAAEDANPLGRERTAAGCSTKSERKIRTRRFALEVTLLARGVRVGADEGEPDAVLVVKAADDEGVGLLLVAGGAVPHSELLCELVSVRTSMTSLALPGGPGKAANFRVRILLVAGGAGNRAVGSGQWEHRLVRFLVDGGGHELRWVVTLRAAPALGHELAAVGVRVAAGAVLRDAGEPPDLALRIYLVAALAAGASVSSQEREDRGVPIDGEVMRLELLEAVAVATGHAQGGELPVVDVAMASPAGVLPPVIAPLGRIPEALGVGAALLVALLAGDSRVRR